MGIAKGNINKQFLGWKRQQSRSPETGGSPSGLKEGVKTDNIETGINFLAVKVGRENLNCFKR